MSSHEKKCWALVSIIINIISFCLRLSEIRSCPHNQSLGKTPSGSAAWCVEGTASRHCHRSNSETLLQNLKGHLQQLQRRHFENLLQNSAAVTNTSCYTVSLNCQVKDCLFLKMSTGEWRVHTRRKHCRQWWTQDGLCSLYEAERWTARAAAAWPVSDTWTALLFRFCAGSRVGTCLFASAWRHLNFT